MQQQTIPIKRSMSAYLRLQTTGLLLLLAASLLLWSCTTAEKSNADESQSTTEVVKEIPVVAAPVQFDNFALTKTYTGTFEGGQQANIVAKITEIVETIPVEIGDKVIKGQVVAKLDRQGPSSRYHQAESAYKNAERTRDRMKALFDAGAVARQTLDDAQTAFEVASAEFEAARSLVDLISPIAGTVTAIHLNVGDVAAPGMSVVTVAEVKRMKIVFHAGESDLRFLQEGMRTEVYSELRPDLKRDGTLTQITKSADVTTRTFEAKALFDNTDDLWFRPGMFGIAQVVYTTPEPVIAIPKTAIVRDQGTNDVFLVEGNTVRRQSVQLGISSELLIEVRGVTRSDSIVTMGTNQIEDGSKITLIDAARFSVAESSSSESAK
ncbi:efflux RND transporter periplasmic adaptor subunit [bacterium]|nr:MAG: efflux RND transporter periplasmic adaptor subunit [bacterium]